MPANTDPSTVYGLRDLRRLFLDYIVMDATEDKYVRVTQEGFEASTPGSLNNCPIARGIKVSESDYVVPYIIRSVAYMVNHTKRTITHYSVSAPAKAMLTLFDLTEGKYFQPGLYRLNAPSTSQKLGRRPTGKATQGVRKLKARAKAILAPRIATY